MSSKSSFKFRQKPLAALVALSFGLSANALYAQEQPAQEEASEEEFEMIKPTQPLVDVNQCEN